ncbi:hypothetical protein SCUCBS95973_007022 [Sporothrix curviconia]|uniref:CFEM domain-containing protein n=1 Tax=Sporothrix curviconia TaxID=1260050 RepID=A0ABP0CC77_9PEZI
MKNIFSIAAAAAALASTVSADTVSVSPSDFPACSINCFTSEMSSDQCAESDFNCHCAKPTLYSDLKTCVGKVCDEADEDDFLDGFIAACAELGVTMQGAPSLTTTAAAAAATTTAATTSGAVGLAITKVGAVAAALLGFALLM